MYPTPDVFFRIPGIKSRLLVWLSSGLFKTREYFCPSLQLTLPQLKLMAAQTEADIN